MDRLIELLKIHRERATIIGVVVIILLLVAGGMYLQKQNRQKKDQDFEIVPYKITLPKNKGNGSPSDNQQSTTQSYFLEPSPAELLEKLATMEGLTRDAVEKEFVLMPVLWPAYFFSAEVTDGKAQLLLDVSENGFGVVIAGEADLKDYPQILAIAKGEKVWVGGEIQAVDPSGTGSIFLKIDHLSVGENLPPAQNDPAPK